ncbi:MAG TPA: translation initiation factor IF-2 [Pyrinomonadaceae bacterium]|jgi:translation initiation factor IF-2|nr:translation initiation factor IF-2 [Pyrinomonadaceae bacterium]
MSKVRIYDLAKELKQESKRLIEEVRREGVDVSVPSNSISKELADKIRNRYFPKKETAQPRAIRVIKKPARPSEADDSTMPVADPPGAVAAHAPEAPAEAAQPVAASENVSARDEQSAAQDGGASAKPFAARLVKKLAPAARAEQPAVAPTAPPPTNGAQAAPQTESAPEVFDETDTSPAPPAPGEASGTVSAPASERQVAEAPAQHAQAEAPRPATASQAFVPGRQVRILRPTAAALNEGHQPGQRVQTPVAPTPPGPTPQERDQRSGSGGGREERGGRRTRGRGESVDLTPRGTPGETATPQTTYIPPPRAGRPGAGGRPGRHTGRGGPQGHGRGDRGGRGFDRDYIAPPKALTREERIAQSLNLPAGGGDLKSVRLTEGSTVKTFAEKLGIKPKDVVALLLQRGVFATINQPLNDDIAVDLGRRFGFDVAFVDFEESVVEQEFEKLIEEGGDDVEETRAPVVTVMGHVDHGKTSLLDAIRTTDVAGGEAGGITQHIGAYSVNVASPDNPSETRRVVFIDTPGHEAFTLMRARGAKATDVVVLVVAADDGVMQQTIEAIEHARAAKVPIVVAINKIDRPDANPDRVRQELAAQGLQPVEWGGDVEMVPVSAKRRENLDTLLETILLTADILNLRASKTRRSKGVVLEVKKRKGLGMVATVLVQQGTLRVGDPFIVGQAFGKVRAMFDDRGQPIKEAEPSTPVEMLGFTGEPQAGDTFQVVSDITAAQATSEHRSMLARQSALLQTTKRGIEALGEQAVKELVTVVKADVQGSVEVLKSTLQKLSTDAIKVRVIRTGVGAITESDVLLASATQAEATGRAVVIIGFNVRPEPRAAELAKHEHVDIRLHSIIYKVEEEIRAAMIGMLEAVETERIIGKADVREVFKVPRIGAVAGCMVVDGTIRRNARARLIRDGVVAWEGGIASLRRFKDDVSEVRQGFDCGIGLENFNDIKVADQIEAYVIEKVAATEL